jgi:hypothetical protein
MNERRASLSDEDILAANRVRKQLGAGSCIICLGEKPNVSLLCCGKAVHINCISKWLYDKTSCPQCRGSMEKMERPPATLRDNLSNERPVESSELSSRQSDRERIQRRRWIIEASRTIHPNALRNHVSESSNSSVVNRGRDEQDFNRSGAFRTFGGGNTRSVLHSVTSRQEGNTNSNFETPPRGINGRFSMPSFSITRNGQANPLSPDTQHMGGGNGNTYTHSQTRSVTVILGKKGIQIAILRHHLGEEIGDFIRRPQFQ